MMEWSVFALLFGAVLLWLFRENAREADEQTRQFNFSVERHAENLLKGCLIPRAPRMIHEEAFRRLSERYPGTKLPNARYFEPENRSEAPF